MSSNGLPIWQLKSHLAKVGLNLALVNFYYGQQTACWRSQYFLLWWRYVSICVIPVKARIMLFWALLSFSSNFDSDRLVFGFNFVSCHLSQKGKRCLKLVTNQARQHFIPTCWTVGPIRPVFVQKSSMVWCFCLTKQI